MPFRPRYRGRWFEPRLGGRHDRGLRISEGGALDFEVVVREGKGETRHHVTMSQEMCKRLTGAGLPVHARPRAKGIDPQTLRRDGDLELFPRVRAGDATLPFQF
jgi:hypothetical protein